ncbi:MAG TPA: ABC transporter substrate-binding protein [Pseudolabrys sp.]|nr:ABC transporter substrate-binding protein [Pseudolabrys sp.]
MAACGARAEADDSRAHWGSRVLALSTAAEAFPQAASVRIRGRAECALRTALRGRAGRALSVAGGRIGRTAGRHHCDLGTPAAIAAKQATGTIPIVMAAIADPVSVGIVSNLARPEGNITGFATQNVDLEAKRLEVLKDLLPQLARVGIMGNTANQFLEVALNKLRATAERLRVALELFEVHNSDEVENALLRLDQARPDAVLVPADTLLLTKRSEITAALAKSKLPAIYAFREFAEAGGLVVHGANVSVLFERAAGYVDRILKGAKPADLPIQLATEFELIINLKTAKALGLTVPPQLLDRADEVIE